MKLLNVMVIIFSIILLNSCNEISPVITTSEGLDYKVSNITLQAASTFSGSASIENIGNVSGTQDATWNVYASTTTSTSGAILLDSDTISGGLNSGESLTVNFAGAWTDIAKGTKYIVLGINDASDNYTDNNSAGKSFVMYMNYDFEDDNYTGWTDRASGDYTFTVVSSPTGGNTPGDSKSLHVARTGLNSHLAGIYYDTGVSATPSFISYYVRAKQNNMDVAYMSFATDYTDFNTRCLFTSMISMPSFGINGVSYSTYTAAEWYKIEMSNINWTTYTFDIAIISGTTTFSQTGISFMNSVGFTRYLDVYNYSGISEAWIDNVLMFDAD